MVVTASPSRIGRFAALGVRRFNVEGMRSALNMQKISNHLANITPTYRHVHIVGQHTRCAGYEPERIVHSVSRRVIPRS